MNLWTIFAISFLVVGCFFLWVVFFKLDLEEEERRYLASIGELPPQPENEFNFGFPGPGEEPIGATAGASPSMGAPVPPFGAQPPPNATTPPMGASTTPPVGGTPPMGSTAPGSAPGSPAGASTPGTAPPRPQI